MQLDKHLVKVQELLSIYSYFKDDNILVVSMDKTDLPFMYIIKDVGYPKNLLVSFAVDFPLSTLAANLILVINRVKPVLLMEEFYIDNNGHTNWGPEAQKMFELDNLFSLEDSDTLNSEPF